MTRQPKRLLDIPAADAAKKLPGTLWQHVRETAEERFEVPPDAPETNASQTAAAGPANQ